MSSNNVLIFAGGTGQRMNSKTGTPKQFLKLYEKEIIVYTLENFEKHPEIDTITIVCLDAWIPYCKKIVKKYELSKVVAIISGGSTGQQSIFNGLAHLHKTASDDSCVLIHDGVRPLIKKETISACIESVKQHGNAITAVLSHETIMHKTDSLQLLDRDSCYIAKAPQCFKLIDIYHAHMQAQKENKHQFIDSASLMHFYGHKLFLVEGEPSNIKVTTPSDYYIFKALLDVQLEREILGM